MKSADFPAEYQKGFTRFLNCHIDLRERGLIPRPETEFWVRKAIEELKSAENSSPRILDMFSGSGCIGIAVLKNIKNCCMDFSDIDKKSLRQIKINLKLNKIPENRYRVFKSNIFAKIRGKYDCIFANPPYVAKDKLKEVQPSVLKYEPEIALFGGKKGLSYIEKFLRRAKNFLTKNGVIFLEFSPEQKEDIRKILIRSGYKECRFYKDRFFKYRFLKCC
jgi:release factor glutamine methyltransferase